MDVHLPYKQSADFTTGMTLEWTALGPQRPWHFFRPQNKKELNLMSLPAPNEVSLPGRVLETCQCYEGSRRDMAPLRHRAHFCHCSHSVPSASSRRAESWHLRYSTERLSPASSASTSVIQSSSHPVIQSYHSSSFLEINCKISWDHARLLEANDAEIWRGLLVKLDPIRLTMDIIGLTNPGCGGSGPICTSHYLSHYLSHCPTPPHPALPQEILRRVAEWRPHSTLDTAWDDNQQAFTRHWLSLNLTWPPTSCIKLQSDTCIIHNVHHMAPLNAFEGLQYKRPNVPLETPHSFPSNCRPAANAGAGHPESWALLKYQMYQDKGSNRF